MQGNTQSEAFQDGTVRPKPFLALAIPLRGLVTGLVCYDLSRSRRSGAPPLALWPQIFGICSVWPVCSIPYDFAAARCPRTVRGRGLRWT